MELLPLKLSPHKVLELIWRPERLEICSLKGWMSEHCWLHGHHDNPISLYLSRFCWLIYISGPLFFQSLCLLAEPLESNLMVCLCNWNSRLIWLFQTGTEADDTAIIRSNRRSIDSRCTLAAADGGLGLFNFKKSVKVRTTHARANTQGHTHTHSLWSSQLNRRATTRAHKFT